jgi:predicted nucleic acid-binding protein
VFWDSSAVVSLLLPERRSKQLTSLFANDQPAIWWLTYLECLSAIYRRDRQSPISPKVFEATLKRLQAVAEDADTVLPVEGIRQRGSRLLATHALRTADAVQLAAALSWCNEKPAGESFVCLDERLARAAGREGFTVLPSGE